MSTSQVRMHTEELAESLNLHRLLSNVTKAARNAQAVATHRVLVFWFIIAACRLILLRVYERHKLVFFTGVFLVSFPTLPVDATEPQKTDNGG
eukprot:CAMPEP_0172859354 /NCGR_PEP_ID=MMETSP1075-20121228/69697_1 /TAXON_ID=2916 /ORGANISM="Ceratium fusus, Strain PA161109" /LENGTH=92 /DNA_ID=CAMNT_0013707141 /DNA_START=85 /DNA_END=360 /DNA_ORIENTATION=+